MARRRPSLADIEALPAEQRTDLALRELHSMSDVDTPSEVAEAARSLEQLLTDPIFAFMLLASNDLTLLSDAEVERVRLRADDLSERVSRLAALARALTTVEMMFWGLDSDLEDEVRRRRIEHAVALAQNEATLRRYREGVRDSVTFEDIARGRVPGIDHVAVLDLPLTTERGDPLILVSDIFESVGGRNGAPVRTVAGLRDAVRRRHRHLGTFDRGELDVIPCTGRRRTRVLPMARVRVPRHMLAELAVAQARPAKKVA